jgi:hypothetical protein
MRASARAKNVRAGAAGIVEHVAFAKPQLLAGRLAELAPALHMPEPQTRWVIIRTFGVCAHLDPTAADAFEVACGYLDEGAGVCLSAAATRYLGDVGSLSPSAAESAFSALDRFLDKAGSNEVDWALESLAKIAPLRGAVTRERMALRAADYLESSKPAQRKRAAKLLNATQGC